MASRLTVQEVKGLFEKISNWGRWGPDDERGALNFITAEKRARAAKLAPVVKLALVAKLVRAARLVLPANCLRSNRCCHGCT